MRGDQCSDMVEGAINAETHMHAHSTHRCDIAVTHSSAEQARAAEPFLSRWSVCVSAECCVYARVCMFDLDPRADIAAKLLTERQETAIGPCHTNADTHTHINEYSHPLH